MNKAILIGRLVKDPELVYGKTGTAVCTFTLAVNRFGKKDEADFIQVKCFKNLAENVANYQKKGNMVAVDGSINTGSYEKDGRKVYTTDILANSVVFLERVSKPSTEQENRSSGQNRTSDDPFSGVGVEIQDDSLPF